MFHSFDNSTSEQAIERAEWMHLLARAPEHLLSQAVSEHTVDQPQWLRRPETGLMMVQGRIGGTGERFNLGEMTVTRCALRLSGSAYNTPVGVSYVMGRNHRHAHLAAVADALLQNPEHHPILAKGLIASVRAHLQHENAIRHERAQTTKVDFTTVAREAGGDDEADDA